MQEAHKPVGPYLTVRRYRYLGKIRARSEQESIPPPPSLTSPPSRRAAAVAADARIVTRSSPRLSHPSLSPPPLPPRRRPRLANSSCRRPIRQSPWTHAMRHARIAELERLLAAASDGKRCQKRLCVEQRATAVREIKALKLELEPLTRDFDHAVARAAKDELDAAAQYLSGGRCMTSTRSTSALPSATASPSSPARRVGEGGARHPSSEGRLGLLPLSPRAEHCAGQARRGVGRRTAHRRQLRPGRHSGRSQRRHISIP